MSLSRRTGDSKLFQQILFVSARLFHFGRFASFTIETAKRGSAAVTKRRNEPMPKPCGTALQGAPVNGNTYPTYSPSGNYYIYCNNPEPLLDSDLGDRTLGNKYILWSLVNGSCQAWYEHTNSTTHPIGYGLQVFNPNPTSVTVTVTNIGFGSGSQGFVTAWNGFFSGLSGGGGSVGTFTVPSQGVLWIQRNENISASSLFEGVVRFSISGGSAYILNYAWSSFGNIDGTATYLGFVTGLRNNQDQGRVYKGIATQNGNPVGYLLTNSMNVSVSSLLSLPTAWRTNGCADKWPDATVNDMVAFRCPLTGPQNPTYQTFSCSSMDNLGNWGIQYDYSLSVTNDDERYMTHTVNLVVAQPGPGSCSSIFVVAPDGRAGCQVCSSNWNFYSFDLAPGRVQTLEYQVILCGDSAGGLVKSIVVQ